MSYNYTIHVSFSYGGISLVFKRTLENMSFVPFYDMELNFNNKKDYIVHLKNTDNCQTNISYDLINQKFDINVRYIWKFPVSDSTIDSVLEMFSDTTICGHGFNPWERLDTTDISKMKEIMRKKF